jgi:hypothetical protein
MKSDEIVIVANDVIPGMSLPVASPGLRAWGLAQGLRCHGHRVTVAVDARVVQRAWGRRKIPPPRPRGTVLATPPAIGDLIRARKPRAVILTNARRFEEIGDTGDSALIYDFFAAKMLELRQDAWEEAHEASLAEFRELKLEALKQSSAVIINGTKKQGYVDDWLKQAGCPNKPKAVVNMPVEPYGPSSYTDGPVHVVIAGYIHPWSHPGEWAEAVTPFVRSGSIVLHLIVGAHWTGHRTPAHLPETFASLTALEGVRSHRVMEYGDFRRFLATCHLSLDLFERNPERELAFVTRTAVSLGGGLAVIHVPFTELSSMIEHRDAGWLLDSHDHERLTSALKAATEDRGTLARKQAGARRIAGDMEPKKVTAPLDVLLSAIA